MDNQPILQRSLPANTKWYHHLPLIGCTQNSRLDTAYRNELAARKIDKTLWDTFHFDHDIKDFVCKTLAIEIWCANEINAQINFHPHDPYFIVGGLQSGDDSKEEVLMEFEDTYEFKIPTDTPLEKMTLIEFIQFLTQIKNESANS